MVPWDNHGLTCRSTIFLFVLLTLVQPVSCKTCDAVVPLAIIVVILAITSCGLLMTLMWVFTRRQRNKVRGRSRLAAHSRPTRVTEAESYFVNIGMSGSTGSIGPTTSQPQGRASPMEPTSTMQSGYGARGHGHRGVHDPPKYVPGTSRAGSQSGYSSSRY